jgi:hypothetical protein
MCSASPQDRVLGAAARPEAEAFGRERRIKDRLQYLEQGLLDQPVQHRRDAQRSHAPTVRFGDFHLPDGLRNVRSIEQFLTDACPVRLAVAPEFIDAHPVDARRPAVPHYMPVRREQVLASHHTLHERRSLVSG